MNRETGDKVARWMDDRHNPSEWMFPKKFWADIKKEVAELLKWVTPEGQETYGMKAMRRGVLSSMARAGVPLQDLMLFSLHVHQNSLIRYLSVGLHARELAERGEKAAHHILPTSAFYQFPPVRGEEEEV